MHSKPAGPSNFLDHGSSWMACASPRSKLHLYSQYDQGGQGMASTYQQAFAVPFTWDVTPLSAAMNAESTLAAADICM